MGGGSSKAKEVKAVPASVAEADIENRDKLVNRIHEQQIMLLKAAAANKEM